MKLPGCCVAWSAQNRQIVRLFGMFFLPAGGSLGLRQAHYAPCVAICKFILASLRRC